MAKFIYLEVPFRDKEEVKSMGARWSPELRQWYISPSFPREQFKKWLPKTEDDCFLKAIAPIYLVQSLTNCWKCGENATVITLAARYIKNTREEKIEFEDKEEELHEFYIFNYIEYLPPKLKRFLKKRFPTYYKDYSKTTHSFYFMNHCSCRAKLGDFYLHSEPDVAFFITEASQLNHVTIIELKPDGFMPIYASFGFTSHDLIYKNAKRKPLSGLINHGMGIVNSN